jgi:competence protein ComEA
MKKKQKIIGSIIILVIFLILLAIGYYTSKSKNVNKDDIFVQSDSITSEEVKENKSLVVEVKGAVKKPGVYSLSSGSRVLDLVNKSEGFTEDADKDSVILVTKLKDSDCIVVRKLGEISKSQATSGTNTLVNGKLNLNTATVEEIVSAKLPRIGAGTAKKIVDYREKNGFKSIEDLRKVGGIGEATLNGIKDKIEVR